MRKCAPEIGQRQFRVSIRLRDGSRRQPKVHQKQFSLLLACRFLSNMRPRYRCDINRKGSPRPFFPSKAKEPRRANLRKSHWSHILTFNDHTSVQVKLRSPQTLSMRATGGQYLWSRVRSVGKAARSRE